MKKNIISILLCCSLLGVFSQSADIKVLESEKIIGEIYSPKQKIKAKEYTFPERIYNSYLDSASGYLTLHLREVNNNKTKYRKGGNIVMYDLKNKKIKWNKEINYKTSSLDQFKQTLVYTTKHGSYCLDFETGKAKWELRNTIYFVDANKNIGIGYEVKTFNKFTNTLQGIDLSNGNILWQRELNRDYSWNDAFYMNDSTLIIVAAGLHAINVKYGSGWSYKTITGKKDYSGTAASNAVGAAAGLLTGTFVMSTGYELIWDVVSNVLIDSTQMYFASKEKLARIDKTDGTVEWSYSLPSNITSKSTIFIKDSLIYMINKGHARMGRRELKFGVPYISAFHKQTGNLIFYSTITKNRSYDPIFGYEIMQDTLTLLFYNRLASYSLIDGKQIKEKEFDITENGEFEFFVGRQVYTKMDDSSFASLPNMDTTCYYVYTGKNKNLVIDKNFKIIDTMDLKNLYIYHFRTKDYKFITMGNKTIVLDKKNMPVARMNTTDDFRIVGDKLYATQGKSILEIDLSGLE